MIAPGQLGEMITDVAILTRDLERAIGFYRDTLGFRLEHRMPGFADFAAPHVRLALWERRHFTENVGMALEDAPTSSSASVMIAVRLPRVEDVGQAYTHLLARGVEVARPPADYSAWNAHALYFRGPDGEVWELYAWFDGGEPGRV